MNSIVLAFGFVLTIWGSAEMLYQILSGDLFDPHHDRKIFLRFMAVLAGIAILIGVES